MSAAVRSPPADHPAAARYRGRVFERVRTAAGPQVLAEFPPHLKAALDDGVRGEHQQVVYVTRGRRALAAAIYGADLANASTVAARLGPQAPESLVRAFADQVASLDAIAVLQPAARHRGLARRLLRSLISEAGDTGFRYLVGIVRSPFSARSLYERAGFEVLRTGHPVTLEIDLEGDAARTELPPPGDDLAWIVRRI